MDKSVGRALESALKVKGGHSNDETKRTRHLFSNRHRRDIFSTLTQYPCIGASMISRKTGIKVNTVSWHLIKMLEADYIVERSIGRKRIFFAEGLVNADEVAVFFTLNNEKVRVLMKLVMANPGGSQMDLANTTGISHQYVSGIMNRLESSGLVSNVVDGSHIRYYPTKLISISSEEFYRRSKGFVNLTLKKLKMSEGGEPSIVKKSVERIIVEIGPPKSRYTMEIGINPFITIFDS